ncbi:hypothetical protein EDB82DRAFT_493969 [Fusarium venenatum]|uniref:uncharacterized protein n=1 Tax=Fusarium venenatum TaxID=56646 RepID=UPI001D8E326C|nr:hypothetical protein EDB82DRAFT_493969 [Fusarium venenatum]
MITNPFISSLTRPCSSDIARCFVASSIVKILLLLSTSLILAFKFLNLSFRDSISLIVLIFSVWIVSFSVMAVIVPL